MTLQQSIGRKVRDLRMEQHYRGKDFASIVGWPADYLSRFEMGKWHHIDPVKLCCLARQLRISIDALLGMPHNGDV